MPTGPLTGEMMTTTSCHARSAPKSPYPRHNKEAGRSNEGWTVTLRIKIPKPRQWLACSTGWVVIFMLYLGSTLWMGSAAGNSPYLDSNSSRWIRFLPEPVHTFLPLRVVQRDLKGAEPQDEEEEETKLSSAAISDKLAPTISLSETKETIEAMGVTLAGSEQSVIQGDDDDESLPSENLDLVKVAKTVTNRTSGQIGFVPLERNTTFDVAPSRARLNDTNISQDDVIIREETPSTLQDAEVENKHPEVPTINTAQEINGQVKDTDVNWTNTTDNSANISIDHAQAPVSEVEGVSNDLAQAKAIPEVVSVTRATNITGRKAVEAFQTYLNCVSESGKWIYDSTPRLLPWNKVGERYLSKCDGEHWGVYGEDADRIAKTGVGVWRVREVLKWVWKTNETCPLQRVSRDELCRRMGAKRNIMVVGDSINFHLFFSIMNHLITNGTGYENFLRTERSTDGVYEMCGDIFGHGNGFKVSFVRNDRLSLVDQLRYNDHENFHEYPWIDLVEKYDVKILLLNRGAHYENDTVYEKSLRETFTAVRNRYPNVQVIYRNTPPGHANCTNATDVPPLKERQVFGWDGDKCRDFFSWGLFAKQNIIAKTIVEEFEYIYMDVDTMLGLRADGHPSEADCLHYCLPGPPDIGTQILYNILPFL